ncbi:MAG: PaaI family thioesterase [Spirochaetota bacterium]
MDHHPNNHDRSQNCGKDNTNNRLQKIKHLVQNKDKLISLFHMEIVELREGASTVRMNVTPGHLNAAGVCHGGTMFSLADVAFALASNSHGTLAVALDMSISFLKPVPAGQTITATCTEKHLGKKIGVYEIVVETPDKTTVALLKATAFRKPQPLLDFL